MLFRQLAERLEVIEGVSARLEITAILAELYQKLELAEVKPASYLLLGSLVPPFESLEFSLSTKMVQRALAMVKSDAEGKSASAVDLFGESVAEVSEGEVISLFKKMGDLGSVASHIIGSRAHKADRELSILEVFAMLQDVAGLAGKGSQAAKLDALVALLARVDAVSAKYVVRIIMGQLRLGFSVMTMIDALSWAVTGSKSERDVLEDAYNKQVDIGSLAEVYLGQVKASVDERMEALAGYQVKLGVPVVPALCQRLNSTTEIIEKMGEVYAEPKYDGMRVQVHISPDELKVFTRNLEDVTPMFPELTQLRQQLKVNSAILDGEAIGYDPQTGSLLPFQQTITRKRKHGVEAQAAQVPLRYYFFDVILTDKRSLIGENMQVRKDVLDNLFKDNELFVSTPFIRTNDPEELRKFHHQQLGEGLEGMVVKQVDAAYGGGRKGWSWVKIKEHEGATGKLTDTLDCVVMGYYAGRGKRSQFGIGAFLVGVLAADDQVVTIAKVGTGLSDQQFRELKQSCDQLQVATQPPTYLIPKNLQPDVWVRPELVVEIAADELTTSPIHTAGQALRFPRLVGMRPDKSWQQATTVEELASISIA
jgi:DNA ligase 1